MTNLIIKRDQRLVVVEGRALTTKVVVRPKTISAGDVFALFMLVGGGIGFLIGFMSI